MDCPRCGSGIDVPSEDLGWERREISRVFGRDEIKPERPEASGHAPTPEKKSRVFKDVTQVEPTPVARTGSSPDNGHEESAAEISAPPREDEEDEEGEEGEDTSSRVSLGARLRKLKKKRLDAPKPQRDDETADPDIGLDEEAFDDIASEVAAAVGEPSELLEDTPATGVEGGESAPTAESESDDDSATTDGTASTKEKDAELPAPRETPDNQQHAGDAEADSSTQPTEAATAAASSPNPVEEITPPYTVRVEDEMHEDLGIDVLAEMVRSGAWTEVVEIKSTNGHWVPLATSPVMKDLRKHLAEEAKSTLKLVASGEWERQGEEAPSRTPHEDESAEAGGTRLRKVLTAVAVVAVTGLAMVVAWTQLGPAQDADTATHDAARNTLSEADPPEPSGVEGTTDSTTSKPIQAARARVWQATNPTAVANALADAGHYKAARHVAIDTWAADRDAAGLQEAFDRAIADDPDLHPEVATLGRDVDIDRIFALGGGRSISFRLTNAGQTLYAFKPEQKEWKRGWRAELAGYLLCEVLVCHFEVPHNRPARISKDRFKKLYGLVETYRQAEYAERFDDLHWRTATGPDGKTRKYLYGVLEAWVPSFVEWPIEYTSVWEDWLDVRYHPDVLDEPLVEELSALQDKEGTSAYSDILSERNGATTRDIARQISSMLLFDFLTSNWDRFSDVEDYYGVNNQFGAGTFISLDLGAAFYDEPINKVASRFEHVTRFSAETVASVRHISPDVLNPVLFPNATSRENYRLALFWTQHDEAIQRIDALIQRYGRDRVLEFE